MLARRNANIVGG
jgi:hypothetical protein